MAHKWSSHGNRGRNGTCAQQYQLHLTKDNLTYPTAECLIQPQQKSTLSPTWHHPLPWCQVTLDSIYSARNRNYFDWTWHIFHEWIFLFHPQDLGQPLSKNLQSTSQSTDNKYHITPLQTERSTLQKRCRSDHDIHWSYTMLIQPEVASLIEKWDSLFKVQLRHQMEMRCLKDGVPSTRIVYTFYNNEHYLVLWLQEVKYMGPETKGWESRSGLTYQLS